ncbi:MAG TPA: hypothetical protein VHG29_05530 [Novosphingobium sp.]|nr:hypothetical protein [Novosphingobium sp.]
MPIVTPFEQLSAFFEHNEAMLTLLGGGAAGAFALTRYWADQRWTKKQFAFDYAQRVFDDPKAMTALRMLDWSNGEMPEGIAAEYGLDPAGRAWDAALVASALRVHDADPAKPQGEQYPPLEYAIRELFDVLLAHLERIGHFVKSGVLAIDDVPASLAYYARLMEEERSKDVWRPLQRYMLRYGYADALQLFERILKGSAR